MYYATEMNLTFKNETSAAKALTAFRDVLDKYAASDDETAHKWNPYKSFSASLVLKNNTIHGEEGRFSAEEAPDLEVEIVKTIASICDSFTFNAENYSDYSQGWFEATFNGSEIAINDEYYPCGYLEYVTCPDCGEDIVTFAEFERGKTYICPDCGEEVNLDNVFDETAPEIKKYTISVK